MAGIKPTFEMELLARGEIKEGVRLVVPDKDGPGSAEEAKCCDARGHGAWRTYRREYDGSPDCRG
jgi:hypothetical protein